MCHAEHSPKLNYSIEVHRSSPCEADLLLWLVVEMCDGVVDSIVTMPEVERIRLVFIREKLADNMRLAIHCSGV